MRATSTSSYNEATRPRGGSPIDSAPKKLLGHGIEPGREDEEWLRWKQQLAEHYDGTYYSGLTGCVMRAGHVMLEQPYGPDKRFERVLEVGAGTGAHLAFIRHQFGEYVVSDMDEAALKIATQAGAAPGVRFEHIDASHIDYPDDSYDRLISMYNLEHILAPEQTLKEWIRVVRPGGILSISIPTEGGLAWNLGRHLTTRRHFNRLGSDYDYIVAREHVNTCARLLAFFRHYFPNRQERWYPLGMPSVHCNLIMTFNAQL